MKFSSLPKRVFALATMGLMATLPTISPASAIDWDHGPWHSTDSSPYGATVYVEEHDDIIKLCDTESDKLHAKVYIWTGPTDNLRACLTWIRPPVCGMIWGHVVGSCAAAGAGRVVGDC